MHLLSLNIDRRRIADAGVFPFTLSAVEALDSLSFNQPVTFFVGENGSGKSTLLEALAVSVDSIVVGGESVQTDSHLEPARHLAAAIKLAWSKRTRKGFFLRAEDFITYTRRLSEMKDDLARASAEADAQYPEGLARSLAKMPYQSSLAALKKSYGNGLEIRSHGESFFDLFQARITPGGLYLLDEPETPLSPLKQIAFLSLLHEMTEQDCQFVIATHSPILMAYPGAVIYNFDDSPIRPVPYQELSHVTLTRDFLNHPNTFLRYL